MTITFEGPAIFVADVKASRAFYEDLLGQEVLADFGPNVPFKSGFSIWQADHAMGVIHSGRRKPRESQGQDNFEMYFEAPDLDAAWARIKKADVRILQPVHEAPWGQRGFRMLDPDGHIVELAEPLPVMVKRFTDDGLTPEQIAERSGMPVEMVRAMLE